MGFWLECVLMVISVFCTTLQGQNVTNELRVFTGLPTVQRNMGSIGPRSLTIRHNLPGKVVFVDGDAFSIELNITVPASSNTSEIITNYKMATDNHSIILEVYKEEQHEPLTNASKDQLLLIISTTIAGFVVLCVLVTLGLYFCWWKKKMSGKDTADGRKSRRSTKKELATFSQKRRFYNAGSNSSTLNVAIVVVIATICVTHAQLYSVTVDVLVQVPKGFLTLDSKIFFNEDNNNVMNTFRYENTSIPVYDVDSAMRVQADMCDDSNKTCPMGTCDPLTGLCICPRGKKLVQDSQGDATCVFECRQNCPSGSFEVSLCNETHPAVCKACRPQCSFKEFESTACAGSTDRNCTDISQLPQIKVSPNIVFEDLSKVDGDVTAHQVITNPSAQYVMWLNRSSGIALKARLVTADFSSIYRQVEHSDNDNEKYPSSSQLKRIQVNFCKTPVPDFYKVKLSVFQEIDVLKADHNSRCPNYTSSSKSIKPKVPGLFCAGVDNAMVGLFGTRNSSTLFWKTEKDKTCYDRKIGCEKCRTDCSEKVKEIPGCNLTRKDVKFGKHTFGEHYSYCFDCCFSSCTCSNCFCTLYKDCVRKQLDCVRVNQHKLSLEPVFPSPAGNFHCHVEVARGPQVVIEASLWRYGQRVYAVNTKEHNISEEAKGLPSEDFGYMIVRHPTILQGIVGENIMVSGNILDAKFKVGLFDNEADVTNSVASGNERSEIHIQPTIPFGVNSTAWAHRDCDADNNKRNDFVVVNDQPTHGNLKLLPNLTAENDALDKVYKVYDNQRSHRISIEVSQNRSVLRNLFPKSAIVNDDTMLGVLYRNRTFWTLRFSGRLNECPGAFNVRMYDQDMPNAEVFNYDVAVTGINCQFLVEFHLPSGGDTNLIDKQFLTKLTDSYKVIQVMLVSPRYSPDFNLPIINSEPDFDLLLRVLLPAAYALGAALVVLIALLIYGYKTRPKDKLQRDRDSKLHFRHILFVIWFVGMRLIKSFLLTLSLFFIIFSAIHFSNVKTVRRYPAFRDKRIQIEKDLMAKMDQHKVQEIDRQLGLLKEGKKLCDEKLREANALMDAYFNEMRKRLIDDLKEKSIIYAAYKRIEKKARAAKEKFDKARQDFNRKLRTITNEINNRIQNIRNKIKGSFWLVAAKILYHIINALASIFGSGLGPFIKWVGLNVGFPSINFNLGSFHSFFDDFLSKFQRPTFNFNLNLNASWGIKLPTTNLPINFQTARLPRLNISSAASSKRVEELLVLDWLVMLLQSRFFVTMLIVLDAMWFVYRHSRTYQAAVVLLHGNPVVYDLEDVKQEAEKKRNSKTSAGSDESINDPEKIESAEKSPRKKIDRKEENEKIDANKSETTEKAEETQGEKDEETVTGKTSRYGMLGLDYFNRGVLFVFTALKKLNYEITKTNLVPMTLLVAMGLLLIYVIIVTTKYAMTVETLDVIGYFDLKIAPIVVTRKIVNTRITASAFMINEVQLPYYEGRVNARIAFARKKAAFFKGFQCTTADLHNKEYCFWVDGDCEGVKTYTDEFLKNLTQLECHVPSVISRRFTKFDRIKYKEQLKKGIHPFVAAVRGLILNTFYTILIILGLFVVVRVLGFAVQFALIRFDMIRTVKSYRLGAEIEHDKTSSDKKEKPIDTKVVGRLKIPDAIATKCGPARGRSGWHLEYKPEIAARLTKKQKKKKAKEASVVQAEA